jgi:DNA polymerase-1
MAYRWNKDIPPPSLVDTDKDAQSFLRLCLERVARGDNLFAYDTETHGKKIDVVEGLKLDWISDTITFWSLCFKEGEMYRRFCLRGEHFFMFGPLLENPDVTLEGWNMKYDAHVSFNSGINIWNAHVIDLLVAGYLFDENLQGRMDLKTRSKEWTGLQMTKFTDLFGSKDEVTGKKIKEYETSLFELPIQKVSNYASLDAFSTYKIGEFLEENLRKMYLSPEQKEFDSRTLWSHFLNIEVPVTEVLWRMERRGMGLDTARLDALLPVLKGEIEAAERSINLLTSRVLCINSPKQLAKYFYGNGPGDLGLTPIKKTGTGAPSTDVDVMEALAAGGVEVASLILKFRGLTKFRNTYLVNLVAMSKYFADGRIHPNFNQYGARTGRFSTSDPNSQNFPRPDTDKWGLRSAFIPRKGYKLIVGDYEQLEMRIMAHFSRDPAMIKAILDGQDLHCFTVSQMYGIPYDTVVAEIAAAKKASKEKKDTTPEQERMKTLRQQCKTIGFGIIYGRGARGVSEELNISVEEADTKIYNYLHRVFPGVGNYIENVKCECRGAKYVRTLAGRRRRLLDIDHSNKMLRSTAERESVNAIIQGSASDIVKGAMTRVEFDERLNSLGIMMINQIHDELVFEVPENNAETALPIIKSHMENPFGLNTALRVPIPVDIKIVDNWASAK